MTYNQKHNYHPIVKSLRQKGYSQFEISYSTKSKSDYGWTVTNTSKKESDIFGLFLGYTIKDALKTIDKLSL